MFKSLLVKTVGIVLTSFCVLLLFPKTVSAANWYVDNQSTGANSGLSWQDAWKSIGSVNWSAVSPGDTVYISGGSSSKTYNEIVNPGANGTSGRPITIDVGANSPIPSGHNGTVIINGVKVSGSWITVNGLSGGNRKMTVQATGDGAYISGSNVTISYLTIRNTAGRGVYLNSAHNSIIRGNDIATGNINSGSQTDGIYIQYGSDNIIENNTVVLGNNGAAHNDVFQMSNGEARLIVRNNWFEWSDNRAGTDSQVCMIAAPGGYLYFYNNVLVGGIGMSYQVVLFGGYLPGYSGDFYFWNNTVVSKGTTAYPFKYDNSEPYAANFSLKAFKNNLIVTNNLPGIWVYGSGSSSPNIYQGNLYYGSNIVSKIGGTNRTWSQHQSAGYDNPKGVMANPNYTISNGYRLNNGSPAINAAENISASYFSTDKDGNVRPQGASWDIGAYEYGGTGPVPTQTGKTGDVNADGKVDIIDIGVIIDNYAKSPIPNPKADVNQDGSVDIVDIGIILDNYGK